MELLGLLARPAAAGRAAAARAVVQVPRAAVAAQQSWLHMRWRSASSSSEGRPPAAAYRERPRAPTTARDADREAQALVATLHRLAKERRQPTKSEMTRLDSEVGRVAAAMSPNSLSMTLWTHRKRGPSRTVDKSSQAFISCHNT